MRGHMLSGTSPATPVAPIEPREIRKPVKYVPEIADADANSYLTAGRLTRLPVPVADIDLNVAGINDIADVGKIEMTILVNEIGIVVDVIPAIELDSAHAFAERIAQRFKDARFIPGEINGKVVKSQLHITVVSENLPLSMTDDKSAPVM